VIFTVSSLLWRRGVSADFCWLRGILHGPGPGPTRGRRRGPPGAPGGGGCSPWRKPFLPILSAGKARPGVLTRGGTAIVARAWAPRLAVGFTANDSWRWIFLDQPLCGTDRICLGTLTEDPAYITRNWDARSAWDYIGFVAGRRNWPRWQFLRDRDRDDWLDRTSSYSRDLAFRLLVSLIIYEVAARRAYC